MGQGPWNIYCQSGQTLIEVEALYTRAYALYQGGKANEAAEIFQLLCTKDPLQPIYWAGFASSLQESSEWELACEAWAMDALLEPANPTPHFHAAQCCWHLGKLSDAALALKEAKKRIADPQHPLAGTIDLLENSWRVK